MNVTERTQIWRIQSDLVDGKITSITSFYRTDYLDETGNILATSESSSVEVPLTEKAHGQAADAVMVAVADAVTEDQLPDPVVAPEAAAAVSPTP